jgi:hypothetical protein
MLLAPPCIKQKWMQIACKTRATPRYVQLFPSHHQKENTALHVPLGLLGKLGHIDQNISLQSHLCELISGKRAESLLAYSTIVSTQALVSFGAPWAVWA